MYVIKNIRETYGSYYTGIDYHGEVGYYANFMGNLESDNLKIYRSQQKAINDHRFLVEIMNISADDLKVVPVKLIIG